MAAWLDLLTPDEIAGRLERVNAVPPARPRYDSPFPAGLLQGAPIPAAVLMPLFRQEDAWRVLFIRRQAHLVEHSGQVAFPGGRADPDDRDAADTALREAWEEIGLAPDDVRLLGCLPPYLTITNYLVTPVIGLVPWPYAFRPAEDEVSRIFSIPLAWLAEPAHLERRWRQLPAPHPPIDVLYFKEYDGEVLWGASAAFTLDFLNALRPA